MEKKQSFKQLIFKTLFQESGTGLSKYISIFITIVILVNIVAVIFDSHKSFEQNHGSTLHLIELISIIIFTIEYLGRLYACPLLDQRFRHPVYGRLRYAVSPLMLIDLVAILPFYLPHVTSIDLRILRSIRLLRFMRLLKIARYSKSVRTFFSAIKGAKEELAITFLILVILLLISSTAMHYVERETNPEVFGTLIDSIVWCADTLVSLGFNEGSPPESVPGRIITYIIGLLGIGVFALPAGILASEFMDELQKSKGSSKNGERKPCPHCGKYPEEEPEP